jgi:thioredoxin-related protein
MKSFLMGTMVVLMAAGSVAAADDPLKDFAKSFPQAQKAAQAQNKPMYLHFTTTWCGWCRKIESEVYATDEGRKTLAGYVCATLDCTEGGAQTKFNSDLMKKWGMSGYPSLVLVTADGAVLYSWPGYCPMAAFAQRIATGNKAWEDYQAFQKQAATADAKSYDWQVKALDTYAKYQKWDSAAAAAKEVRKLDPANAKGDAAKAAFAAYKNGATSGAGDAQVGPLLDDIRKLDSKNEKGFLEKALMDYASVMASAQNWKRQIELLTELTTKVEKLSNGLGVYATLGDTQVKVNDPKAALASYQKALDLAPTSPYAATLKKKIDDLKTKLAARG